MHMLHVEIEQPPQNSNHITPNLSSSLPQQINHISTSMTAAKATPPHEAASTTSSLERNENLVLGCDNQNNIIARIIADFSDIETDSTHSNSSFRLVDHHAQQQSQPPQNLNCTTERKTTYDELIFTCNGSSATNSTTGANSNINSGSSSSTLNKGGGSTKVSLISHRGRRHHRIVTKSYRNGVTTVDMQVRIINFRFQDYSF